MGVNVENFTLDIFFCPSILTTPDVDQEVTEYSTPTDKYEFENKSSWILKMLISVAKFSDLDVCLGGLLD